VKIRKEFIII